MDKATLVGLVLAIGGTLLGLMLEGGNLGQVLQPTAAMIVFGGTLGAILIQYPLPVALSAFRAKAPAGVATAIRPRAAAVPRYSRKIFSAIIKKFQTII